MGSGRITSSSQAKFTDQARMIMFSPTRSHVRSHMGPHKHVLSLYTQEIYLIYHINKQHSYHINNQTSPSKRDRKKYSTKINSLKNMWARFIYSPCLKSYDGKTKYLKIWQPRSCLTPWPAAINNGNHSRNKLIFREINEAGKQRRSKRK